MGNSFQTHGDLQDLPLASTYEYIAIKIAPQYPDNGIVERFLLRKFMDDLNLQ